MNCPFNIGDKVVYIKPNYVKIKYNTYELAIDAPIIHSLTQYKVYTIVSNPKLWYDTVGIINDNDNFDIPNWQLFISTKQYRKLKLEKLNDKNAM